jgi:hypothetical protein
MQNFSDQSGIDQPEIYQIIIKGGLDVTWRDWFDDLTLSITTDDKGKVFTTLTGPVKDQGVLHGILARIRDLGLPLIEVRRLEPGSQDPNSDHEDPS